MKKLLGALVVLVALGSLAGTGVYLWRKSRRVPVVYETVRPTRGNVVQKAVATGSVVPRKEVEIKPQISGILSKIEVEPGQLVKQDDVIAHIAVVPDMVTLNAAESRVNRAKTALENAQRDLARNRTLLDQGVVSDVVLQGFEKAHADTQEELKAATGNLELVKKGTMARAGATTNTLVRATIGGMVLAVPRQAGNSVIQSNNFNDGTTIATIADMDDLIFKGKVDESEVGKIKPGMDLQLKVGALEGKTFEATLEYIAPKGVEENGAIQFEIRAALRKPADGTFIRANLSANADIVLARRDQVLTLDEGLLKFKDGEAWVEVETAPQRFEKRKVTTGLSDGIRIEVVSGVGEGDAVKAAPKGGAKG